MGCVASRRIDKEGRVQICKERKRLMKQLLVLKSQFAAAQMAYLQALKNTGVTLGQFTDSECLDVEIVLPCELDLTSSPPPLPPPPPPLPPFSPDHDEEGEVEDDGNGVKEEGEVIDEEEDIGSSFPPPPFPISSWDPFVPPSSSSRKVEEEDWAETSAEFDEEGEGEEEEVKGGHKEKVITDIILNPLLRGGGALVVPRSKKKTLSGIIKEIDDYFLKASASGRDVIRLLDVNKGFDSLYQNFGDSMRKSGRSSKVFSALSWSWSSRSLQSSKDTMECYEPGEPCKPGAHGVTLEQIYTEEEKLYKEIKEEENTKMEYGRKTLLLEKYEDGDQDLLKTEETRSSIETLQYDLSCFQQAISETNLTILKLIEEELHPQLIILSSGLAHMWRTMYECHLVQNRIAQQVNHLTDHTSIEPTTDYHRQSTVQLETEVNGWYISFCNLLKSQGEYVQVLNRWVQLTDCLVDGQQERRSLSIVQHLCEHWNLSMYHLPDKVPAEAVKSFLSVIHTLVLQQAEEHMLQKKLERLEKRLQREINALDEMEKKLESNVTGDVITNLSPNHPLVVKRAKTELFRKRVEDDKTKYLNSVKLSHSMTLNNLKTSLPNVFQALSVFSNVCAEAFEAVNSHTKTTTVHDGSETEICESFQVGAS